MLPAKTVSTEGRDVHRAALVAGFRQGLPFAVGALATGVAFGAEAVTHGMGARLTLAFSAVAFSGTAQFATLSAVESHGSLLALGTAVFALNARYVAFGGALASAMSRRLLPRLAEAQLVVDASWALALRAERTRAVLLGAGFASLLGWLLGTAAGILAGHELSDSNGLGIDAVVPLFFVALALESRPPRRGVVQAIAAAATVTALTPVLPAGMPLLVVLAGSLAAAGRA